MDLDMNLEQITTWKCHSDEESERVSQPLPNQREGLSNTSPTSDGKQDDSLPMRDHDEKNKAAFIQLPNNTLKITLGLCSAQQ